MTRGGKDARDLRTKLVFWTLLAAAALGWMWLNALGVREFGEEALARSGLIGTKGTVTITACATEVLDTEINTRITDCAGPFTPDGETTASPDQVRVAFVRDEMTKGTRVDVRLVDDVAYESSWWRLTAGTAGALFFGLLGGLPLIPLTVLAYQRIAGPTATMRHGLAVGLLASAAIAGEWTIAALL
ncbi:hypothetical protein SAMN05421748_1482 [Paractinoplanes atraurantiacus]|uniref:Uncharacterized protein n=1 Tax=Paractinoplanes atraurantiacus TaxID=1036182 RepID=A0A285KLV2_9ACTN|nr:hypothetical protein SAMN05421748_1482 [Actinoplanes atraurantiacus]